MIKIEKNLFELDKLMLTKENTEMTYKNHSNVKKMKEIPSSESTTKI